MTAMDKPEVHFQSVHDTGNIYFILFLVRKELQKLGRVSKYEHIKQAVFQSESYIKALQIIREEINLIDDDGVL